MIPHRLFWDTLTEKNITTYKLINCYGIGSGLIDQLRNDGDVKISSVDKLYRILNCSATEVAEFEHKWTRQPRLGAVKKFP